MKTYRFFVMTKRQHDLMLRTRGTSTPVYYMERCLLESLALHHMRFLGQWLSRLCVWDTEKSRMVAMLDQYTLRLPYDSQAPPLHYYHAGRKLSHAYPDPHSRYDKSP